MNSPHTPVMEPQKRSKGSGPVRCRGRTRVSSAPYLMEKSRGTTSTVWSGWKCVKKMRSTANGSSPARSMPRTAPEPRSKTSISPPASTATQLCLLSRRGTTVPEPTTVTSILRLSFPAVERPGEPCNAEEGAADHVRHPVYPEVYPARGHQSEDHQDSLPPEPAR